MTNAKTTPATTSDIQVLDDSDIDAVGGAMGIGEIVGNIGRTMHLIQIGVVLTIGLLTSPKCN